MMNSPLRDICCASLPEKALPLLAPIRHAAGVRVRMLDSRVWIWWDTPEESVVRQLFAVPGIELYEQRGKFWYRLGQALPAFHVPLAAESQPLTRALLPAPIQPVPVRSRQPRKVGVRLVRDQLPRATTAMLVGLPAVTEWMAGMTTAALEQLSAAWHGDQVLLRGARLPLLADSTRCWGRQLLIPLGWRAEPAIPERALCEAFGVTEVELVLWLAVRTEVIPLDAFAPLTRAGLRLAAGQA